MFVLPTRSRWNLLRAALLLFHVGGLESNCWWLLICPASHSILPPRPWAGVKCRLCSSLAAEANSVETLSVIHSPFSLLETWRWLGACRELPGESQVAKAQFRYGLEIAGTPFLKQALISQYWVPLHEPEGSCCSIPLCAPAYLCKHIHILLERFQGCREPVTTLPGEAEILVLDEWGWMKQVEQLSGRVFSHLKIIFMAVPGCTGGSPLSHWALCLCSTSEARLTCSWHVNVWRHRLMWHKYMQWFKTTILQKKRIP